MILKSGTLLQGGHYSLLEAIGSGGFGITYRGLWHHQVQGRMGAILGQTTVCIKEFFWKDHCTRHPHSPYVTIATAAGKDYFVRLKQKTLKEADLLSRLSHPNIVRVLDKFEENGTAYVVMEFIEGLSLRDKINRQRQLSQTEVLHYARQLCSAVDDIHRQRIMHLDIKPANILIDNWNNVHLIDFGISKQYDEQLGETSQTPVGISPGFSPIEQYSGVNRFQPGVDIYALGATLYNALTGQVPMIATSRIAEQMLPISAFNREVSPVVSAIIEKAMAVLPESRFQSASEFWNALHNQSMSPSAKSPASTPPRISTIIDPPAKPAPLTPAVPDGKKPFSSPQTIPQQENKKSNNWIWIASAAAALILILLFTGLISSNKKVKEKTENITVTVPTDYVTQKEYFIENTGGKPQNYSYTGPINPDTGKPNGEGEATFDKGDSFKGIFKEGLYTKGTYTSSHGWQFEGDFDKCQMLEGTLIDKKGEKFKGEFKDDKPWEGESYDKQGNLIGRVLNGKPN